MGTTHLLICKSEAGETFANLAFDYANIPRRVFLNQIKNWNAAKLLSLVTVS